MDKFKAMSWFELRAKNNMNTIERVTDGFRIKHVRYTALVQFVSVPVEPDVLRQWLPFTDDYMLIVVDRDLLPGAGEIVNNRPDWLQILHALYYGRIYCYDDNGISAMHLERIATTGDYVVSYYGEPLNIGAFKPAEIDCLHHKFPGHYRVGTFGEYAWWKPQYQKKQYTNSGNSRTYSVGKSAQYYAVLGLAPGADKTQIKTAHRLLAKKWHPDICPLPDATVKMQEINVAYEWLMEYAS